MCIRDRPYKADTDASDTEKGTYPHYMMKEIEEQPFVIRKIMSEYSDKTGNMSISEEILQQIRDCDKIYIIACGTSYHAGLIGKQYFEKISHKPTEVIIASEFNYNMPLLTEKPLFMFISQSGETADCRAVLVKVKEMGYKTLALTNVKGSTLSREADNTLLLYAGPEIAVASTKAYTAQITVLAILAAMVDNIINIDVFKEGNIMNMYINPFENIYPCWSIFQSQNNNNMIENQNATGFMRLHIIDQVTKENIPYATITAYVTDEARRDIPIMHLVTTLNPVRIELPIAQDVYKRQVLNNNEVYVCKERGRISDLRKHIDTNITGNIGIGHTRWATHGAPNQINSHPHQSSSKRFTLVHNGIIENEEELKQKYLSDIEFQSDTDTEVIVQLIEKFVNDGEEVELAIRHTMSKLIGSYALAIIDKEDMNTLYAAKNKTPLLAGKGNGFNMLGSCLLYTSRCV